VTGRDKYKRKANRRKDVPEYQGWFGFAPLEKPD